MVSQNSTKFKRVHCIGVGGIGISAAAVFLSQSGARVTGSDVDESETVRLLRRRGVEVSIGHDKSNVPSDTDLVLHSPAVPQDNPELVAGRNLGVRIMSYPEFLGELSQSYRTIAVSGTHGKSTVTAMLGLILEQGGYDPTVIVGSRVPSFEFGNVRMGASPWLVVEACEHQGNMRHIACEVAVVTSIEKDHLDYYRDLDHITATFQEFVDGVAQQGTVVVNGADQQCARLAANGRTTVTFCLHEGCDWSARNTTYAGDKQQCEVVHEGVVAGELVLRIPGAFNVANALAAIAAAAAVGVSFEDAHQALERYTGIWRRFELVGIMAEGVPVISDYGHHPTAVAATVDACRQRYPGKRVVLVFQPHQHNRTKNLFDEFVAALSTADAVVGVEIYDVAGREEASDLQVSTADIVQRLQQQGMRHAVYAKTLADAQRLARSFAAPDTVMLVMGAGDVWHVAQELAT